MGIFHEQGNGRMGTMIRHLRFVFGLIMLSVFVAGSGATLDHERPTSRGLYGTSEMNNVVTVEKVTK